MGAQWMPVADLEAAIGHDATEILISKYGGRDLHIRKTPHPDLVSLIGRDAAETLSRLRGGSDVRFPVNKVPLKVRIIERLERGLSANQIAEELGCGNAYVESLMRALEGRKRKRRKGIEGVHTLPMCLLFANGRD